MTDFTANITFAISSCADCSIPFALTKKYRSLRENDHKTFYCPNGHPNYYPQVSDEEKLKKKVKQLKLGISSRDQTIQAVYEEKEKVERSRAAFKGHLVRINRQKKAEKGGLK